MRIHLSATVIFLLLFKALAARQGIVQGRVISQDNDQPLAGVSVKVKGAPNGTLTQPDGHFTIKVKEANVTLVFTYLGYLNQEIKAVSGSSLVVNLVSDPKLLGEVVVTGYGGKQSKLVQTGSIGAVNAGKIWNSPFTSADKALQGRIAGVLSLAGNGQPGSIQQIRIRGASSINSSNEPLFIIDGIPVNSGELARNTTSTNVLAGINSNDIESITVLKDASAASIYGSRAANGVILINTKKGEPGKTAIRFDAEYGVLQPAFLNDRNKPLNASQYRELTAEGIFNAGSISGVAIPTLDAAYNYYDNTIVGSNRQNINTDWLDVVTRTGRQDQYNLSANGGNEKTTFNFSGGYFKQDGAIIGSKFERTNGSLNLRHVYNEKLSFGGNMLISNSQQSGPYAGSTLRNPVLGGYFIRPFISPYMADGVSPNISSADFPASGPLNPLMVDAFDSNQYNLLKGLGGVDMEYKILPGLSFSSKIGIDYNNIEEDLYLNPDYGDGTSVSGYSYRYYTRYFNWVWTNLLNYNLDILNDKALIANIRLGYEAQKSKQYTSSVAVTGLPSNYDITAPTAGATLNTANGAGSDYSFASFFSLADISYKNRYVLSGSFRRDGSSRFSVGNVYGNFWSVGGSWNLDQEKFLKNASWMNQLKLRGSYGKNGNAGIGNYDWRALYGYGQIYNYNGTSGSAPSAVGNSELTWEENHPLNIGIDMGFLRRRLALSVDWYTRKTTKLLLNSALSHTSGFDNYLSNLGAMKNSGVEFTLSGTPVERALRWDLSFNIAINKNRVLYLNPGQNELISGNYIRKAGSNYQTWYFRLWAGVDPANGSPLWYTDETRSATTNSASSAKTVSTGYQADPKGFGSLNNTFTFRGFSLDALFYYSYGNHIRDGQAHFIQSDGASPTYNRVASQLERWQNPGDITNVPKYVYNNSSQSNIFSTRYLYKGDFIRLRDITLGYQIPKLWLSSLHLSGAKLYARGSNLLTFVKDKDLPYDPEAFVTSTTNFTVYMPKTLTFGANISL